MLLHGEGRSAWPLLRKAKLLKVQARIGLEDTLERPDGTPAGDNAELVRLALNL
ncbi:MAG: 3-keto-5-aminohexanoate cleavage protein [Deinococcus sp.]|nr:3-keto-5-aminohexanoate cleavage protein [Deinococcus sp.]